jgi:very-short-patch-repair endonuclease
MTDNRKLADNVMQFMSSASDAYGRIKAEQFSQDMYCNLVDSEINSPIEDMFYVALQVQCAAGFQEVNPDPVFDERINEWRPGEGVHVYPQFKIGKYRVDFLILYTDGPQPNQVVVELDGHDFHDKDKAQRAYEKGRDRYLVANGYRVLHYTGSEVVADPHKVAYESLDIMGANQNREGYSPSNQFGID